MRTRAPAGGVPARALSLGVADRIGVRLEGLDDERAGRAMRPLLPLVAPGARTDLTIRFVDEVEAGDERLWPLPAGPTGATGRGEHGGDGLWMSDHLGHAAVVPIDVLDGEPVLVDRRVDPGFFHVWVWLPLLRLALARAGGTLVHAAGFADGGRRVALAAWGGTGKTAVLLECLAAGADFLGDDWVALFDDGTVAPVTTQINLNPSHRRTFREAPWPGSRGAAAAGALGHRAMGVAARATTRLPQLSMALGRAGDLSRAMGRTKVALPDLFPATTVAEAGTLDSMVLLTRSPRPTETREQMAEAVAAMNRVELAHLDQLLAALTHLRPGALPEGWTRLSELDRRVVRDGLANVDDASRHMTGHPGEALVTGRWVLRGPQGAIDVSRACGSDTALEEVA